MVYSSHLCFEPAVSSNDAEVADQLEPLVRHVFEQPHALTATVHLLSCLKY